MTPEQIEGGRFCLPEREVRYWPSNQWEISRQKENSADTEARKIGEIEEETNQASSDSDNRKAYEDKDEFTFEKPVMEDLEISYGRKVSIDGICK